MSWMPDSPKGREIRSVSGDADAIVKRGREITTLGTQMHHAADTLERLKNSSVDENAQKGKAIEALRDSIDDSYKKLREAGDLYEPVGPVFTHYGESLLTCKPHIDALATACEEAWRHYTSLPGDVDPRGTGGLFQPDPGSPEAKQNAQEDAAKKAAYDAWHSQAESWDGWYDTWEDAFETACHGVSDGMSGKIKDSFWSTIADILEIAALVIGIVALIFGGEFLIGLAALASLALLVAKIGQKANGEASTTDVVLAVVGCLPFGKIADLGKLSKLSNLTKLTKLAQLGKGSKNIKVVESALGSRYGILKDLKGLATKPKLFNKDGLLGIYKNRGARQVFNKLTTGNPRALQGYVRSYRQFYEGANPALAALRSSSSLTNAARVDFAVSTIDTLQSRYNTGVQAYNAMSGS